MGMHTLVPVECPGSHSDPTHVIHWSIHGLFGTDCTRKGNPAFLGSVMSTKPPCWVVTLAFFMATVTLHIVLKINCYSPPSPPPYTCCYTFSPRPTETEKKERKLENCHFAFIPYSSSNFILHQTEMRHFSLFTIVIELTHQGGGFVIHSEASGRQEGGQNHPQTQYV